MTTLEAIQKSLHAEIDALNRRIASQLKSDNELMDSVVSAQLRTHGKQIRPTVLMLCAKIFKPVDDNVLAAAAAVELLHNASLIHDDVVDNSDIRRGYPTINSLWDNHIAVLVGDFFTGSALQQAILTGDMRVVEVICNLGKQLSMGEIDQIHNAQQHSLTEEAYFKIISNKTASLFVSCARLGCYTTGASADDTDALTRFAEPLGLCFQMRDDIFDYYDSDVVGKPTGNDLREGKITLPLIHALNTASGQEAAKMRELAQKPSLTDSEIAQLQKFARENGGIDYAFASMQRLRDDAAAQLNRVKACEASDMLQQLLDYIIARDH